MKLFETKLEREARLLKYDPHITELQAAREALALLPKEGEMNEVRGGIGNGLLLQLKKEDGIIYKRRSRADEWEEMNFDEIAKRLLSLLNRPVEPTKKWYEFWK